MPSETTSSVALRDWRTPGLVIVAACAIALIGFGVRASFGLFLQPMTVANGWTRGDFALALAIQNLLWGIGAPFAGALAEKRGPVMVMVAGTIMYVIGVVGMGLVRDPLLLHLFGGVLTGLGVAFTAFSIALASIAKAVGPERRSLALGLGTAAGSAGQALLAPVGQALIAGFGWEAALFIFAGMAFCIAPLALILPNDAAKGANPAAEQSLGAALREACAHRGFVLLTFGFFVCGFHVAFITVHFPAYVQDLGLPASVGAFSIALVGLFNIVGSFGSGAFGQRYSMKRGLTGIYVARAVVITLLLLAPKTVLVMYLFAAAMGVLWLSTVPLTSGIVAQVFGVRYMATLFGVVFFSHQVGSFIGVWLGGYLYGVYGGYDPVWWVAVALSLIAAAIHLPIDERPLARISAAAVGR